MNAEMLVLVAARALVKARWSLWTVVVVVAVVGLNGCFILKGFTREALTY